MAVSRETWEAIEAAGLPDVAQYAVSMAYRIRFVMQMTAREAMHLTELRSQPTGHPVYRRVAQAMHEAIARGPSGDRRRRSRTSRTTTSTWSAWRPSAGRKRKRAGPPDVGREPSAGRLGRPVVRDGATASTTRRRGHGRHRRRARRSRPDSIFYVGSIAKQFVAACVAAPRRRRRARPGRPRPAVGPRAPGVGRRGHARVTSRTTRRGSRRRRTSPTGSRRRASPVGQRRPARPGCSRSPTLVRPPGTAYAYTNHGYTLLGEVVARASGTPLAALARERLVRTRSAWPTRSSATPTTPLPDRAARGHFEATDGTTCVEPARVPRGRRGRAVDDRRRPRARGTPASYDPARRGVQAHRARRARRRHADPLRLGRLRAHAPRAADPQPRRARSRGGPRRWSGSPRSARP